MSRERFDTQAPSFDERSGIPPKAAVAVAAAVLEMIAPGEGDVLVELGAGTGEIGRHLARSISYLGLERSSRMLDVFHAKLGSTSTVHARLAQADVDRRWPVESASATAVFASRVAHLLDLDHLQHELARVCIPGAHFLVGHVSRDELSVKNLLRARRQWLQGGRSLEIRSGRAATGQLLDRLTELGASRLEARPVVAWSARASARQVLDDWAHLASIGGMRAAQGSAEILAELLAWASRELGDPDTVEVWEERYIIEGVRFGEEPSTSRC